MFQVIDKPCWPLEAINALRKECLDDYDRIMSHPEKFGKTKAEMAEMFQPYLEYKNVVVPKILEIISRYDEVRRYLITEETKKYDLLMAVAMAALDKNKLDCLDSRYLENPTYQKRCLALVVAVLLEEDIDVNDSVKVAEFNDPAYVIRRMENLEVSNELKLKFMDLYLNMDGFLKEFYQMMEEMIPCLQSNFYLVEQDYRRREEEINSPMFEEYLKNGSSGVVIEFEEDVVYTVNVNIFQYNSLSIVSIGETKSFVLVYIGLYFHELVLEKKRKNLITDTEMLTVCKALGDANRYKMLKLFLKNEKMYLQELAKEIGVTPATASHHITLLMDAELITMLVNDKEKKVVYYKANRERLQQISQTFLNMANPSED
jgi:DNA-binding transcriptional ArsR family regulator